MQALLAITLPRQGGILLDDDALVRAHGEAAAAIAEHMLPGNTGVHLEVSTTEVRAALMLMRQRRWLGLYCVRPTLVQGRRQPRQPIVSSLAAFWPGLEVLAGDVEAAREHIRPLLSLAAKHGSAPELYDVASQVRMSCER